MDMAKFIVANNQVINRFKAGEVSLSDEVVSSCIAVNFRTDVLTILDMIVYAFTYSEEDAEVVKRFIRELDMFVAGITDIGFMDDTSKDTVKSKDVPKKLLSDDMDTLIKILASIHLELVDMNKNIELLIDRSS